MKKTTKKTRLSATSEMRMSSDEFDRMMQKALSKPPPPAEAVRPAKDKAKKSSAQPHS